MELSELTLRITLSFLVLFFLARMMGRKEISQMTFFNFVSAIAIGSIASSLAINQNLSIRNGVLALIGWSIFTIVISIIDIKFKNARKVTTGEPIIVVKEGKIMENSLRSTQLDMDALNSMLRQKGVFSLKDVELAIFESSGQLSVMKKQNKQSVTKGDMKTPLQKNAYPSSIEIISDGKINQMNLSRLNLDTDWLKKQLQNNGIQDIKEVFYAEIQQDGSIYIDHKDDHLIH